MNEKHDSGEPNQEDRCVKRLWVPSALVHVLDIDLEMLESGLEGQGGFDRQQKGTRGQLCCLHTIRLSAETFTLPSSILPFLCLAFFFPSC